MHVVIERILDDLDGEEIPDGGGEEITLTLNKTQYTMDLRSANVQQLHEALAPFIKNARRGSAVDHHVRAAIKSTRGAKPGQGAVDAKTRQAIKLWAVNNGVQVKARGRLPQSVVDQYYAAQAAA